jgi:hypothetical protein
MPGRAFVFAATIVAAGVAATIVTAQPARPAPPGPTPQELRDQACAMPPLAGEAKLVLFGTSGGAALSSVAIASQDMTTTAANVIVEPGREPLYIVLTADRPVIWQFTGAVQRVTKLVLFSRARAAEGRTAEGGTAEGGAVAGATGLARDTVAFAPERNCLHVFTEADTIAAVLAKGAIRRRTGHPVDVLAAAEQASTVSLPSGRTDRVRPKVSPGGADVALQWQLARYFPAGIAAIDAAAVVSALPTERYEVLPREAGLLQLLASGAIKKMGNYEYLVRRKIRFPAELPTDAMRFLIAGGVPAPDGNPGNACVVAEDGGVILGRRDACR